MEEEQISLIEIAYMLMAKWYVMVIAMIVAAAIAFSGTLVFITPKYQSTGELYVSSKSSQTAAQQGDVAYNTLLTSQMLVNTYIEILRSNSFLNMVSEDIGGKYTVEEISKMLTMSAVNETELLNISVLCADPYDAYKVTNAIIKNAADEIERVIEGGSVKIIDNASTPTEPATPNVYKNTAVGALAGFLLGAVFIFLKEMLDTRVKAGEDMQGKYSIPVLGEVPWIIATDK